MDRKQKPVLGIAGWVLYFVGCLFFFSNSPFGFAVLIAGIILVLINARRGCREERIYRRVAAIGGSAFIASVCMISQSPLLPLDSDHIIWIMFIGFGLLLTSEILRIIWKRKIQAYHYFKTEKAGKDQSNI